MNIAKKYNFSNVSTFHRYCYSILTTHKNEIGFGNFKKLQIADDEYEYRLIDEILKEIAMFKRKVGKWNFATKFYLHTLSFKQYNRLIIHSNDRIFKIIL